MGAHQSKRHSDYGGGGDILSPLREGTFFDITFGKKSRQNSRRNSDDDKTSAPVIKKTQFADDSQHHTAKAFSSETSPQFFRPRAKTISQAYPSLAFWRMRHPSGDSSPTPMIGDSSNYYNQGRETTDDTSSYMDYLPKKISSASASSHHGAAEHLLPTVFRWELPNKAHNQQEGHENAEEYSSSAGMSEKMELEADVFTNSETTAHQSDHPQFLKHNSLKHLPHDDSNDADPESSPHTPDSVVTTCPASAATTSSSSTKSPKIASAFKFPITRKHHHHRFKRHFRHSGHGEHPKSVYLVGSWDGWKRKIPLVLSDEQFSTILEIPEGTHQFNFIIDNERRHDEKLPYVANEDGSKHNVIQVKKSDFEVFDALADDMASGQNSARNSSDSSSGSNQFVPHTNLNYLDDSGYSSDVPSPRILADWERLFGRMNQVKPSHSYSTGPPILPPQLLQVILNRDVPYNLEPGLLPEPNHVMVNHLYALSIKDGVMVMSSTHRHNKKYVTTLLYKPVQ